MSIQNQGNIMFTYSKVVFFAAIALFITACAPGPKFSGLLVPKNDQGDIYLYRKNALFAIASKFEIDLDGNQVGDLYNASYLHLQLPQGKHILKVSPGALAQSSTLEIQSEPNKIALYEYDFVSGPLANPFFIGSSIQPRTQEQAIADMKELNAAN